MKKIKIIVFDADDTLWVNEPLFTDTREKCESILAPYIKPSEIEEKLYETEMRNLHLFGYGIKGFVLSMIETAVQLVILRQHFRKRNTTNHQHGKRNDSTAHPAYP